MNRLAICLGLLIAVTVAGFSLSFAQPRGDQRPGADDGFHVTIKLYDRVSERPVAEHVILFDAETIYALPAAEDEQITVIDIAASEVSLIDRKQQVRTTVSTDQLKRLTTRLRDSASTAERQQRLGIDAIVEADSANGSYSVEYGIVRYSTTTQQPASEKVASRFGTFADLISHLNVAQKRGLPPFGRMKMNTQIAAAGRVPLETQLRIDQGTAVTEYRSTHEIVNAIDQHDRERINEVANMLVLYKELPFTEFPTE